MLKMNWQAVRRGASIAAMMVATGLAAPALAQEQAQGGADSENLDDDQASSEAITVTGSRISRSGFNTPTPVTALDSALLERQGQTNIGEFLEQIPAVRGSSSLSTAGLSFRGGSGGSFINLRGLGASRTLVLVDGQRVVSTTTTGLFDLNTVPTLMVERTEVVTGGASAAYGSDAVSGVANLILRKKFNGLQADFQSGVTQYGDDQTYRLGLMGGFDVGERGHFLLAAEYAENEGIGLPAERDFARRAGGIVAGAGGTSYIVNDLQLSTESYGGIITAGPLRGTAFDAAGNPFAFVYGNSFGLTGPGARTMTGGSNPGSFNNDAADIKAGSLRYTGLARFDYEFSPALKLAATLNYANTKSSHGTVNYRDAFTIRRDNAFIPASILGQIPPNGTISVGKIAREAGENTYSEDSELWRGSLGFSGDLGAGWAYDAYASYGKSSTDIGFRTAITGAMPGDPAGTRRWQNAIDSVRLTTGPNAGQIVCRVNAVTVTSPGCVPLNIFGENALTDAQLNWLVGTQQTQQSTIQKSVGASVRGEPFSTWAGKVSLALGGEYRKDSYDVKVDGGQLAGAYYLGNTQPAAGAASVWEGFAEVVVPLAADMSFFKALDFNGAVRLADYSTVGGVTTWKAGLNWTVSDSIRFRATRSRDIRAPNLVESTSPLTRSVNLIRGAGGGLYPTITQGNPNLTPEKADTLSFGAVLTPQFVPGLRFSVDYFDIKLNDAIVALTAQEIVTACNTRNVYCNRLTPGVPFPTVDLSPQNQDSLRTSGLDFELAYGFPLGKGRMDVNALASYVYRYSLANELGSFNRAGQMGTGLTNPGSGTPRWTGNVNLNYNLEPFNFLANVRVVGAASLDKFANPALIISQIGDLDLPAVAYLNLTADWKVIESADGKSLRFTVGIDNVLNQAPPREYPFQLLFGSFSGSYYDVAGRRFRVSARVQF